MEFEKAIIEDVYGYLGMEYSEEDPFAQEIATRITDSLFDLKSLGFGVHANSYDTRTFNEVLNLKDKPDDLTIDDESYFEDVSGFIRGYVCEHVKIAFDPPGSAYVTNAINDRLKEQKFRLARMVEDMRDTYDWLWRDE